MFIGERLELLDGLLIVGEPQGSPHAAIVMHVGQVLTSAFGAGWHARLQAPLALDDDSEPEPDVAIVTGAPLDYLAAHPSRAALIVEVAESSLRLDRRFKAECPDARGAETGRYRWRQASRRRPSLRHPVHRQQERDLHLER